MRTSLIARSASALAAVALLAGCVAAPAPDNYAFGREAPSRALQPLKRQLLVGEPAAVQPLDGDGLLVMTGGRYSMLGGGRWSDRIPRLMQSRLVAAFESGGKAVGRAGSGLNGDLVLGMDLRAFEIERTAETVAKISVSARIVDAQTGRILAARSFTASSPVGEVTASEAAAGLERAADLLMPQITRWAAGIAAR